MTLIPGSLEDRRWRGKYGDMTVIATDQFRGRLQECPCGKRVWSSWGNAEKHAIACPRSGHPVHSPSTVAEHVVIQNGHSTRACRACRRDAARRSYWKRKTVAA